MCCAYLVSQSFPRVRIQADILSVGRFSFAGSVLVFTTLVVVSFHSRRH